MQLESVDGVGELMVTIVGYEFPDDLIDERTANWLEVDVQVRTPHGSGASRTPCMLTWDVAEFADWLDAFGTPGTPPPSRSYFVFPEPNLQLEVRAQKPQHVGLHVSFILERPGQWEMDDMFAQETDRHYIGAMDLLVSRIALHRAAASLRADLQSFPRRTPRT